MANICTFSTTIQADPEKLAVLKSRLDDNGRLGLDSYDKLFDDVAPDDFEWGSKWMDYSVVYDDGGDWMEISGDTAWGPVSGLWQRISEKYDATVETTYDEPGSDFGGTAEWQNGENLYHNETRYMEHVYNNDNDYFWDEVESRSYDYSLEEIIDDLGDLYEKLSNGEKQRINEMHQSNFSE
jgi:hypothetical protein